MKNRTSSRSTWLATVILGFALAVSGCAEKQKGSSWPLDTNGQSDSAAECDQGPLESVSLVKGKNIQELFGDDVSREALAVHVRGKEPFGAGSMDHMLKIGEVIFTEYTYDVPGGGLAFLCEECTLKDLQEGDPVVYGKGYDAQRFYPQGSPCFVYEDSSFEVE